MCGRARAQAAEKEDAGAAEAALEAQSVEMEVPDWEFVSEHALAREYVASAADVVSVV
jgi:hypothetical protein